VYFSIRSLVIITVGVLSLLPAATFADTYHTANFSGQLGSSSNIKPPFAGNGFNAGGAVTGSFVYDDNLIPSGTGFVNVFFSGFPDIAQIPSTTAFDLSVGGLTFGLGDADTPLYGTQEAAIQYNNGVFNGFFYISDFMFQGNPYELSLQGGVLAIYPIVGGFPGFNSLVNGSLNTGNGNLSGISVFTPAAAPVPEPATGGLLGISLFALVLVARKYGYRVAAI
jgi:hypothetical protein